MANEFIIKNGLISQGNITVTGSVTATSITISGSSAATLGSNTFIGTEIISGSLTISGSGTPFTLNTDTLEVTGSIIVTSGLTGSVFGTSSYATTASYALNATTGAYANTSTSASYALNATTGAYANTATSASYALNATTFNGLASSIFATTGSNTFIGTQTITGSVLQSGSFTTTGTIIAQTINVQQVTSSIVYSCGSNIFGTSISNTQQLTGSVGITGSLTIAGASSATSYNGATIFGSTIACSPIGCFATSCATSFIGGTMSGTCIIVSSKIIVGGTSGDIGTDLLRVKGTIITDNNAGYLGYSSAGNRFELAKISSGDEIVLGTSNSPGAVALISGTGQDLILRSNGTCERIRITSAGNVGIGTNSPNFKTHISTGDTTSITQPTAGTYGLYIQQNSSGNVGGLYIQDGASNSGNSIFVGDNNGAARFVVNTDGNVGIGIATPSSILDVQSAASIIKLKSTTGTNSVYTNYENCSNFYVGTDSAAGGSFGKACAAVLWQVSCNSIVFATSNTEQMRITGGGNVGIGTAFSGINTASQLTIKASVADGNQIYIVQSNDDRGWRLNAKTDGHFYLQSTYTSSNSNVLVARYDTGNVGIGTSSPISSLMVSKTLASNQTYLTLDNKTNSKYNWGIDWAVLDSTNVPVAAIRAIYPADNDISLAFFTYNGGGNVTERMRITVDGNQINYCNIFLNLTSVATVNSNSQSIGINGVNYMNRGSGVGLYHIAFGNGGNLVGTITSCTTATQFNTTSDYRLKTDLKNYNGICLINQIKTYDFAWKLNDARTYGVIAHELSDVIPYAVTGEKDALDERGCILPQAVDYSKIVTPLIKAVQEQQCTICSQASMINTLKTCLGII
jgi:hypothetical protein